jgi:hypothetical protein
MTNLEMVKKNGFNLQYIKNQTLELCKIAVEQDGLSLMYIQNQTLELCKIAVKENGLAI